MAGLQKTLVALDKRRCDLLDRLEALNPEVLVARPIPGKWSILEIVEHMVLAEREVLQHLPRAAEMVARRRGLKDHFTYPMVMLVLRCHIPVKAPSAGMIPTGGSPLSLLRRQWDESQQWLRAYVDSLDQGGMARAVFQHPIAGPLNVTQAVRMGQAHLSVHTRQIRKRLSVIN